MKHNPFDDTPVRFLNKSVNDNERSNYNHWWQEQIRMYGTSVTYYINKATIDSTNDIYGEDLVSGFDDGKELIITLNLNENAIVMEKFGLVSDDEITAFIHIDTFYEVFGNDIEPKAGDVFDLTEFGAGRPGGRGGKHFEITERVDQDVQQINPLIGHYVWLVKAKRHDRSHEIGMPEEKGNDQIHDDVLDASKQIFDYTIDDNDDVYGGYS